MADLTEFFDIQHMLFLREVAKQVNVSVLPVILLDVNPIEVFGLTVIEHGRDGLNTIKDVTGLWDNLVDFLLLVEGLGELNACN